MTGLAEFLLARIAEDEEMARAALPHFPGEVEIVANVWEDACAHIARHDPARVLAECEAKRRIVGWYQSLSAMTNHDSLEARHNELLHVLIALASVYADHPDYRGSERTKSPAQASGK